MLPTKGYAAHGATSPLVPFNFERRDMRSKDVLIEILYCCVCHSDIHNARNEWRNANYPMVPGREIVGLVKQVGGKATEFKSGDLVGVGVIVDSCGRCDSCVRGFEHCCKEGVTLTYNSPERDGNGITYGGYSNQIVTNEKFVHRVSHKIPASGVVPLLCAGITTYSPLRRWKVGRGHKVGVVGLGGLGHMAVRFAASFGAEVTILSTSSAKETDAKRLGAHGFVLTTDEKQAATMKNYFDFIVDTVSAAHDHNTVLGMLDVYGVLINVGLPPSINFDPHKLIWGDRVVTGSMIGGLRETQEMLDYCAEKGITSDVEVIPTSKINNAFDRTMMGNVKYRFVIDMATL